MSCNLYVAEFPVVNPLGIRASDLEDFASDSATWSTGGATGLDSSSEVFLRFEDCLVFGCLLRFPDLVVVSSFKSDATVFDFGFEVDFPFSFATGSTHCGRGAENSG